MHFGLALSALVVEALAGYPAALYARAGHPATWLGALIGRLDRRLNRDDDGFARRRLLGVAALAALSAIALVAGVALARVAAAAPFGEALVAVLASSLLAQRSLYQHVADVGAGLSVSLDKGREAVARIVGRDVSALDGAGVSRAAIESLAENFSDGVVAPVFYLALFGLPGALLYKAVNTADSMIGHKSPRHLAFGWAAARADDLLNVIPARIAALLLAAAAAGTGAAALRAAWRDAAAHASPNAGWPEAAMAGALGLQLGGPRTYGAARIEGARLGDGRRDAGPADIARALGLYLRAGALLWMLAGLGALGPRSLT